MTSPDRIQAYDERAPDPAETERFTAALGCFWGPDAALGALEGVVRTRVGYAGGTTDDPTYHDVGDHSEAVQVDYDPGVLPFADLVDAAVANHDPRNQPRDRQYQHVVFHESAAQRRTVEERLSDLAVDRVATRIEPLDSFTVAEPYHQTFNLRGKRAVLRAFEDAGYGDDDRRESPAAAKLNAHVAGKNVPGIDALL
ncbi:MAG: peptide-methionine (S)-S-oxide reductase [Haloarculaceae archaeon]